LAGTRVLLLQGFLQIAPATRLGCERGLRFDIAPRGREVLF
jgi:hypothetical protein